MWGRLFIEKTFISDCESTPWCLNLIEKKVVGTLYGSSNSMQMIAENCILLESCNVN